jgi:hypothetical protein
VDKPFHKTILVPIDLEITVGKPSPGLPKRSILPLPLIPKLPVSVPPVRDKEFVPTGTPFM